MQLPEFPINYAPQRDIGAYDLYVKPTLSQSLGAVGEDTAMTNPTRSLVSLLRQDDDTGPLLEPNDANELYGIGNLRFEEPVSYNRAKELYDIKKSEMIRQEIIRKGPQGFGAGVAKFGTALAYSMVDPLNIASGFIPSAALVKSASIMKSTAPAFLAARGAQTVGQRAAFGAAEGAFGAAMLEPFVYLAAQKEHRDYDMADSMANLAFGSILGGGLHAVGRYLELRGHKDELRKISELSDTIDNLDLEDRQELLRTSFSEAIQDQMPRNADALIQRYVINKAKNFTLKDLTYRVDGTLSMENQQRLIRRSNGENTAAVPVARFASRSDADKYIRATQDRGAYITQLDEQSGEYVVSNIRKSEIAKNIDGTPQNFVDYADAAAKAKELGDDWKPVALAVTKGKSEQNFVVIRGISDAEAKAITRDASFLEFYEPQGSMVTVDGKGIPTMKDRVVPEKFIADNNIKLKQPQFDPNDLDNDLFLDKPDFFDTEVKFFSDTSIPEDALKQGDELIEALRSQDDFLTPEQRDILKGLDDLISEAEEEAVALKALGFCMRRTQ